MTPPLFQSFSGNSWPKVQFLMTKKLQLNFLDRKWSSPPPFGNFLEILQFLKRRAFLSWTSRNLTQRRAVLKLQMAMVSPIPPLSTIGSCSGFTNLPHWIICNLQNFAYFCSVHRLASCILLCFATVFNFHYFPIHQFLYVVIVCIFVKSSNSCVYYPQSVVHVNYLSIVYITIIFCISSF